MIPIQTGQMDLHIVSIFVESLNRWIDEYFDIPCVFVKNHACYNVFDKKQITETECHSSDIVPSYNLHILLMKNMNQFY